MRVTRIINNNAHDMCYNVGTRAGPGHGPQARPARVGHGPAVMMQVRARPADLIMKPGPGPVI